MRNAYARCRSARTSAGSWWHVCAVVTLVWVCAGCAGSDDAVEERGASIQKAVIAHLRSDPEFVRSLSARKTFLVDEMSRMPPWTPEVGPWSQAAFAEEWAGVQSGLPGARREAWDALIAANRSSCSLPSTIGALDHAYLVSSEVKAKFFLREEPGIDPSIVSGADMGFMTMTMPGIASDGTQALMFVSYWCGPLCGWGRYFLLERLEGRWTVAGWFESWIS